MLWLAYCFILKWLLDIMRYTRKNMPPLATLAVVDNSWVFHGLLQPEDALRGPLGVLKRWAALK